MAEAGDGGEDVLLTSVAKTRGLNYPKDKSKRWWRCGEKGAHMHPWWECKLVQPLWGTVWRVLKKLKVEPPYPPVIPLLGVYLKEMKPGSQRDICTLMLL